MSAAGRGARNAFRNGGRTMGVTVILGLAVALALTMLLSHAAVQAGIDDVNARVGNVLQVRPAGEGGGFDPTAGTLSEANVTTMQATPHVASVVELLTARPSTTQTSLQAPPIQGRGGGGGGGRGSFQARLQVIGTNDLTRTNVLGGGTYTLTSGSTFDATGTTREALVGKAIADSNSLAAGSTFKLYGQTMTVTGVFDVGNQFGNNGLLVPVHTLQELTNRTGQVQQAIAFVDTAANVNATRIDLQARLGPGVDVIAPDASQQATQALTAIANVSLYTLTGAVVAGTVILLLAMVLVVRERRREIGVLKSLGASNGRVVTQFVVEASVLAALGTLLGVLLGLWGSSYVLRALVGASGGGGGGGGRGLGTGAVLSNLRISLDPSVLFLGLALAALITVLGSAFPAFLISKVRPAETLRGE